MLIRTSPGDAQGRTRAAEQCGGLTAEELSRRAGRPRGDLEERRNHRQEFVGLNVCGRQHRNRCVANESLMGAVPLIFFVRIERNGGFFCCLSIVYTNEYWACNHV